MDYSCLDKTGNFFKYFKMDGQMFERRFVETVLDIARHKGMTQQEFARATWPMRSDATATSTIIALKRHNSRGKPQNLRVADAIRMAEVVGREYPSLCFEVWENLKLEMQGTRQTTLTKEPHPMAEKQLPPQEKITREALAKHAEAVACDNQEV